MATNPKSDVDAKAAYVAHLLASGFDSAMVTGTPADITATKNGKKYYFEIKFTRQENRYFGAATLTEWEAAIADEDRFRFVVAFRRDGNWEFHEYTPSEFMRFSYVPPFKVFFNVALGGDKDAITRQGSRAVVLTRERLRLMAELYAQLREPNAV
jgi:hypothetical protein